MEEKTMKIGPNKKIVALIAFLVIMLLIMVLWRDGTRLRYRVTNALLLAVSIYFLAKELHTTVLDGNVLVVQRHLFFIERRIPVDKISSVEYVDEKEERLLIALKGCPSFEDSICRSTGTYILAHPLKVIAVRCPKGTGELWIKAILEQQTKGRGDSSMI